MDDVTDSRAPAADDAAPAATASRRPKRRTKRSKARAPKRATRAYASVAQKMRRPGLSRFARRLLVLARFGSPAGTDPLTLAEIDHLTGQTVGLTHAFVGKTQNPHVETLFAYARLFGVHPAWFITGFGPRPHVRSIRAAIERARDAHRLALTKAAIVAETVSRTAERLRGMSAEEIEAARQAANVGGR